MNRTHSLGDEKPEEEQEEVAIDPVYEVETAGLEQVRRVEIDRNFKFSVLIPR